MSSINTQLKLVCRHKAYLYKQLSNNKYYNGDIRDYSLHMYYLNELTQIKTVIHNLMITKDKLKANRGQYYMSVMTLNQLCGRSPLGSVGHR